MTVSRYNWRRFWVPTNGSLDLSDGGFLQNPMTKWGKVESGLVTLSEVQDRRCLLLFGEPGIGKSFALRSEYELLSGTIQGRAKPLQLDLKEYGSEQRLVSEFFDGPEMVAWRDGDYDLHLFVDSLDEGLLHIKVITALLPSQLKKLPLERLYFRITCRTADWPPILTEELKPLFRGDVGEFELAPLMREDVESAARQEGIDAKSFIAEVERLFVVPLAIKPVTLKFLTGEFKATGHLPAEQSELYKRGCRLLAAESNPYRNASGTSGRLDPDQRLAVARRIAGVTVFSNKFAISRCLDYGATVPEDVHIRELVGGIEPVGNGEEVTVDHEALVEVLGTGLFSARGSARMGWAHQTYAEFLAAAFLVARAVDADATRNILISSEDQKLIPQLGQVAAWLSALQGNFPREIWANNAEVFLTSGVLTQTREGRSTLVAHLLDAFATERLLDDRGLYLRYETLDHPNLANQLRPYIADRVRNLRVRSVAIDIAENCRLKALQEDLATVALDDREPFRVRKDAAFAVCKFGDAPTRSKLVPLLQLSAESDPDQEIKGWVLQALWPGLVDIQTVLAVIGPRPSELIGSYVMFLSHGLAAGLCSDSIAPALDWVAAQPHREHLGIDWGSLIDSIMFVGWELASEDRHYQAYARAAISRLRQHDELVSLTYSSNHGERRNFREIVESESDKRRQILRHVFGLVTSIEDDTVALAFSQTPLVYASDIPWFVKLLREERQPSARQLLARLVERVFWNEPETLRQVYHACEEVPELDSIFKTAFEAVPLDSDAARQQRELWNKHAAFRRRDQAPKLNPPAPMQVATALGLAEAGDLSAFWQLLRALRLKVDSTIYDSASDFETDIRKLPGWERANDHDRERFVALSKNYLLKQNPNPGHWIGKNIHHFPDFAGYQSFRLLLNVDPPFLHLLPLKTWKAWAPVLAAAHEYGTDEHAVQGKLVGLTYRYAAEEVLSTLLLLVDDDNAKHKNILILQAFELCWDLPLSTSILTKLDDPQLSPMSFGVLLEEGMKHQAPGFPEKLLETIAQHRTDSERAVVAAALAIKYDASTAWTVLWPTLVDHPAFGRSVVEQLSHPHNQKRPLGQQLSEEQLADLYLWLVDQSPYPESTFHGARFLGPSDFAAEFRDYVLHQLKSRGTLSAIRELERVASLLPELSWMRWHIEEAKRVTRQLTWSPLLPKETIRLGNQR